MNLNSSGSGRDATQASLTEDAEGDVLPFCRCNALSRGRNDAALLNDGQTSIVVRIKTPAVLVDAEHTVMDVDMGCRGLGVGFVLDVLWRVLLLVRHGCGVRHILHAIGIVPRHVGLGEGIAQACFFA